MRNGEMAQQPDNVSLSPWPIADEPWTSVDNRMCTSFNWCLSTHGGRLRIMAHAHAQELASS